MTHRYVKTDNFLWYTADIKISYPNERTIGLEWWKKIYLRKFVDIYSLTLTWTFKPRTLFNKFYGIRVGKFYIFVGTKQHEDR